MYFDDRLDLLDDNYNNDFFPNNCKVDISDEAYFGVCADCEYIDFCYFELPY